MTHTKYSTFSSSWDYKYHNLPFTFFFNKNIVCVSLEEKERICNEGLAFLEIKFIVVNFTN